MSTTPKAKPTYKQGDVVHAPFASPNAEGTYSKHRTAYVAEVRDGNATLVYFSASGKSLDGMRYTGELNKDLEGLRKNSFWDAGQTTTVPTEYLTKQSAQLRPETQAAIEASITKERTEFKNAQLMIDGMRKNGSFTNADALAAKTEATHRHVRIDHAGNVFNKTIDDKWSHHGRVLPETMAEMKKDAARYQAPVPEKAQAQQAQAQAPKAPDPNEGKLVIVKENGSTALLGPAAKEQLRSAFHGELDKAGHSGTMPDALEIKKIAISVAGAQPGERIAVTAAGAHQLLHRDTPNPPGATVLDAAALRVSAKIAESAVMRTAAGPVPNAIQGVAAAAGFFDNASGHALSKGPLGDAIAFAGEKSGAFHAVMKAEEALSPVLARAGAAISEAAEKSGVTAFVAEQVATQTAAAQRFAQETGLDKVLATAENLAATGKDKLETLIRDNVHGPDNPARMVAEMTGAAGAKAPEASDIVSQVQRQLNSGMQEAGLPPVNLNSTEAAALAKELTAVKPGDQLVVEKGGTVYLTLGGNGERGADVPKTATVLDADALRQNSGIARATDFAQQKPEQLEQVKEQAREQRVAEMSHGPG